MGTMVLTCCKSFLFERNGGGVLELKGKHLPLNPSKKLPCREGKLITRSNSRSQLILKNQMTKPATYSSSISTDTPLHESPEASFDEYLEDKSRVFEAMFPDKLRSQQLNEALRLARRRSISPLVSLIADGFGFSAIQEEWRIEISPFSFLFLTAWPVIDMRVRYKSQGIGYPPGIPQDITTVVELEIIRWELLGLDHILNPSEFSLCVKAYFYPERRGAQSQLKGQFQMNISFDLPPAVSWIPADVRFRVVESGLKRLMENMKHDVNGSLLADYSKFKKKKLKAKV